MTNYTKTMMESLAEVRSLQEDNMDLMRKAAGGAAQKVKMKDGKLTMDMFTASAIMQVYDKVNPANQKKMAVMINKGTKAGMAKLQDFAMKQIKSGYGEEVELGEGKEKGPKQLTNPNKEVMVVKKNKVVVIDKKDQDKYLKQGWELAEEVEIKEGTWALPKTQNELNVLRKLLKKPIPAGKATEILYDVLGDDELFDDIGEQEDKDGKNTDVRHLVKNRMAELGIKEEVELDEAKYELYHKDFSSAMQHAYKMAKKLHGITIDPKEIDDKVATGPSKPSEGKTNSYRLEGDKGGIQIQVYNKGGSKPYELNMYKEEVDLDEISPNKQKSDVIVMKKGPTMKSVVGASAVKKAEKDGWKVDHAIVKGKKVTSPKDIMKAVKSADKLGIGEEDELDEAILKDRDYEVDEKEGVVKISKKNFAKVHKDSKGTDKSKPTMMVLTKKGTSLYPVKFTEEVDLDEGKMSELHQLIKDGKSAKEIAKIMTVDEKTIQKLMSGYNEAWEIGTDEYREYLEKLTPGEKREVEEASARADAMRAMRGGSKVDPADVDTDASDEDIKAASKHIIMQLRKAISLKGNFKVEFGDKKKIKIPAKIAQAVIQKYNTIKKPAEKEKFQTQIAKSHKNMLMILKAGYESTDTVLGRIDKKLKERKNG